VQPLLPILGEIHQQELSDALDAGVDLSSETSISVENFSQIYWPEGASDAATATPPACFVWSIDKRLHYLFTKAFVARDVFASISETLSPLCEESIARSLVALVQELSCKEGRANVYFVQKEGGDGCKFEIVLDTHKEVRWSPCSLPLPNEINESDIGFRTEPGLLAHVSPGPARCSACGIRCKHRCSKPDHACELGRQRIYRHVPASQRLRGGDVLESLRKDEDVPQVDPFLSVNAVLLLCKIIDTVCVTRHRWLLSNN
jgi:hypothetical protein